MEATVVGAYDELVPEFGSEQAEVPKIKPAPLPRFGVQCSYPIGELRTPGFRYCAAPVAQQGAAYCLEHKRLCHVLPSSSGRVPAPTHAFGPATS